MTARLSLEVLRGAAETIELRLSTPLPVGAGTPQLKIVGRNEDDPLSVVSVERNRDAHRQDPDDEQNSNQLDLNAA